MKDYSQDEKFWKRLKAFVSDIQTGCCAGEEEKDMILNVCNYKINKMKELLKQLIESNQVLNILLNRQREKSESFKILKDQINRNKLVIKKYL